LIEEDEMSQVKVTLVRHAVRRIATVACVAVLGVAAAGCGSGTKQPATNSVPKVTNAPASPTSAPSSPTNAPTTAAPKSGGAGF
jgi:hypothetical protein